MLAGFGDQTVSVIDESFQAPDEVVHNAVSSWQAQSANPPNPRHSSLSSSLPPSSPPLPLSPFSESDLGDLGPPQDEGSEDAEDTSSSDPFGFFSAQKKIRARRKHVSPSDVLAAAANRASKESPEASFSSGEAFATPSRARSRSSSLLSNPPSDKPSVDKDADVEYSDTATKVPITRPKRARIPPQPLADESEDEPKRRLRGKPSRKATAILAGRAAKNKPVAKRVRRGKAAVVDDDETEKVNIPLEKEYDDVCAWYVLTSLILITPLHRSPTTVTKEKVQSCDGSQSSKNWTIISLKLRM